MVLKRTVVVALPLSLDLPLSNILDGSALRDIPGHYQKVVYRWTGAWLGLNLVSSSLLWFVVQFSSHWAMFHSSFSSIIDNHSLLVIIFFFFCFTRVLWASYHHHCHHPQVLFLEPPFLHPFLITSPSQFLTFWTVVGLLYLICPSLVIHPFLSFCTFFAVCLLTCHIGIHPACVL